MPAEELPVPAEEVTVVVTDFVAVVEFHRPPNNFFDTGLIQAIADACDRADADPSCRAIVLCSEGKNFCAGAKIGSGATDPAKAPRALYRQGLRLFTGQLPIVAAVQGAAVGGGFGLALAADFRVATAETRFNCNFARLGFHQGFGVSATLPAIVGQQRALEMLYTGGQMRGDEALRTGLCDRLAAPAELRGTAFAFASEIASSGPLAVRAIRRTMRRDLAEQVRLMTELESQEQLALTETEDFAEGVRAMAERRPPTFEGR